MLGFISFVFGFSGESKAQNIRGGSVGNYTVRQYYSGTNNTRLKFELTGDEAVTLTNGPAGRVVVKTLHISQFNLRGERELSIESPACIYDDAGGEASSAEPIQITHGNDQLKLTGNGFLFRNRTGALLISNNVNANVRLTNSATPLHITSQWFEFDITNRFAVFHENVRASDAERDLACRTLGVRGDVNSRSMSVVEADGDVDFFAKASDRRLSAQHCVYTRADDRAVLTGGVSWSQGRMSGSADGVTAFQVSLNNSQNVDAQGRVRMKLPREQLQAAGGFLSGTNKPVQAGTNSPLIDVAADRFTSISNQISLAGSVVLDDTTNRLVCDRLDATSVKSEAPGETAVASGSVKLMREGGFIAAERAAYSKTDGRIVFSGSPHWQSTNITGSAEQLVGNAVTHELFAQNNVVVRYSLDAGSKSLFDFFPKDAAPTNSGPVTIEMRSKTFNASQNEREAVFSGGVSARQIPVDGKEPRLVCDTFSLKFAPGNSKPESFRARGNVAFEQGTPGVTNGPATYRMMLADTVTARALTNGAMENLVADGNVRMALPDTVAKCGRALYTAGNQWLELTGNPTLENSQFVVSEAQKLVWDRASNRFRAEGHSITTMKSLALPPQIELPRLK